MRLIDADKMCNDLATVDPRYDTMVDWCIRVTEAQPTVDAVEVVRCIDCQNHEDEEPGMVWCPIIKGSWVNEDFYCADGIRREDEE